MSTESLFHFTEISVSEMTKEVSSLNLKKAGTFGNIPTKVRKISPDICYKVLEKTWNSEILGKQYFLQNLKLADITPVFKRKTQRKPKAIDLYAYCLLFLKCLSE